VRIFFSHTIGLANHGRSALLGQSQDHIVTCRKSRINHNVLQWPHATPSVADRPQSFYAPDGKTPSGEVAPVRAPWNTTGGSGKRGGKCASRVEIPVPPRASISRHTSYGRLETISWSRDSIFTVLDVVLVLRVVVLVLVSEDRDS